MCVGSLSSVRKLTDDESMAVGIDLPIIAAFLARLSHASSITIFKPGVVDLKPVDSGGGLTAPYC